ncbi:MAG: shikimate dehydrogenase [Deinococcus-Thermus bacterium]|jgi:shikimate dehydrogenase|nr:shikimate dehydrogenase [Deinococcota bacterium]
MHDAAFAALGVDARYEAWDVPPSELAGTVARLREPDVLGANVTVPHKRAVMELLDRLAPEARAIGAVNVIAKTAAGLEGSNSDAEGFLRSLREAGVDPAGRHVRLLGAGGAARAVGWAFLRAGVARLEIVNRTHARAEELAADLADGAGGRVTALIEATAAPEAVGVWVQATSLGMRKQGRDPQERPVPAAVLEACARSATQPPVAVDLVYRPRRTPFLRDAEAAGMTVVDGTGMLVHQGAVAFEAWTGRPAPVPTMRAALVAALAEDGS